jgi:hypothetical protein
VPVSERFLRDETLTAEKQGEFTVASLAQALCDEYDVVMAQAEKDCEAIIAQWQKEGLV